MCRGDGSVLARAREAKRAAAAAARARLDEGSEVVGVSHGITNIDISSMHVFVLQRNSMDSLTLRLKIEVDLFEYSHILFCEVRRHAEKCKLII